MGQLFAIALGGAAGSILRFLVANGFYAWLGRDFPYGTLAVNIVGSFLMGLFSASLVLNKAALSAEYRVAILVGFLGGFTTFSSFALDTLTLIEQGAVSRALLNVFFSVSACLLVVWLGVLLGRALFVHTGSPVDYFGLHIPQAQLLVNITVAFIIGLLLATLLPQALLKTEYKIAIVLIVIGGFLTLSSVYLLLYFIEHYQELKLNLAQLLLVLALNVGSCGLLLWLGVLAGNRFN